MLDGIQPYLDEGEKIYVGKLDSLKAFTGKNRIKIEGKMMYGVNQVKCVISYKDPITLEEKFKEFPIERTEPRETFEFMLENLTEGHYPDRGICLCIWRTIPTSINQPDFT